MNEGFRQPHMPPEIPGGIGAPPNVGAPPEVMARMAELEKGVTQMPRPPMPAPETPPEPPKPEITKLTLNSVDGSEMHLAQVDFISQGKDLEKVQIEIAGKRAEIEHLNEKAGWVQGKYLEKQKKLLDIMARLKIPDGWRFERLDDGTYLFTKPLPQQMPGRPPQVR